MAQPQLHYHIIKEQDRFISEVYLDEDTMVAVHVEPIDTLDNYVQHIHANDSIEIVHG
jgi:hypothetical protein|tara:strand:+ start:291 stop:464 length:174 start_codon:yes stop_codon:yes gene_type:complete